MHIVFTGDVETHALMEPNFTAFNKLMQLYKADFDYVVLEAGENEEIASRCDATILVMNESDYTEKRARKEVEKLSQNGCLVLGVVLNNSRK